MLAPIAYLPLCASDPIHRRGATILQTSPIFFESIISHPHIVLGLLFTIAAPAQHFSLRSVEDHIDTVGI